jgi:hypothetical protein
MIEKERLHPVCEALAREDQFIKLFNDRHVDRIGFAIAAGVFVMRSVEVRVKHRRYAIFRNRINA